MSLVTGAAVLLLVTGCGSSGAASGTSAAAEPGAPATTGKLLVATTVSPITSIAAQIAGDRADVQGIIPEGTNSHTYEPAPSVAELLSKANVILVNGLKLEDPTMELANANKMADTPIIEIGTTVLPESDYIYDFSFPKEDGKPNPHLWTDPLYAIKYAAVIRDTLSKADPTNAAVYAQNYDAFAAQANALADALRADQVTIPNGNKKLLTYHDAYAYFGKNFGWDIIGAVQPKNFSDPTPAEVVALIEQIKAQRVPTIFGSEVFPSNVLKEIGEATGARYEESLRDDDLPGKPGDPDHSWLGLMRYNYVTMVKGLGGTTKNLEAVSVVSSVPDNAIYPQ